MARVAVKKVKNEFRIFKHGLNRTANGDVLFDAVSAASVMSGLAEQKQAKIAIDYGHGMAIGGEQKSAGWFTPTLRKGQLWATQIEWTPVAKEAIEAGEWLYISPAFVTDTSRKRVAKLFNVALTNTPATFDPVSVLETDTIDTKEIRLMSIVPFETYMISEAAWDAQTAESLVKKWAGEDMAKYAKAFIWFDSENPDVLASYKLPHHSIEGGELVTVRAGVIAAAAALQGARGGVDIPEGDIPQCQEHIGKHYKEMEMIPPWEAKEEEEEGTSDTETDSTKTDTVKTDSQELLTELASLKQENANLRASLEKAEFLVTNAARFTSAELGGWVRMATLPTLQEYLKTAALRLPKLTQPKPTPRRRPLSSDEASVANLLHIDAAEFEKHLLEQENRT